MALEQRQAKNKGQKFPRKQAKDFDQKMVDLARVTRVMAGGKRMSFRACLVIGDRQGRVSFGVAKGPDVQMAISKAVRLAEKHWLKVNLTASDSIPHEITYKFKSANILLKPAPVGTGVKAGGALRVVLDLAGVKNVVAKQIGSNNKINNVKAVYGALGLLSEIKAIQRKSVKEGPVKKIKSAPESEALRFPGLSSSQPE